MRVHRIVLENPKEFFDYYESGTGMIIFETKAVFGKGEEVILEFDFPNLSDMEHLRVSVRKVHPHKAPGGQTRNRVIAWVLPHQRRKLDFLLNTVAASPSPVAFRRNYTRHPVSFKAAWSLTHADLWHPCEIRNLGLGGMMLAASSNPPAGTRIVVNFTLPALDKNVRVAGQVVWVDRESTGKNLMGLQFAADATEDGLLGLQRDLRVFFRRHEIFGNATGCPNQEDVEYYTTSTSGMN